MRTPRTRRMALAIVLSSYMISLQFPTEVLAPTAQAIDLPPALIPYTENWREWPRALDGPGPHSTRPPFKIAGGGHINDLHLAIMTIATEVFDETAQVTGTTAGSAYRREPLHQQGWAIDLATGWRTSLPAGDLVALTQTLARRCTDEIDSRCRVVLYRRHGSKPDHVHVAIRSDLSWSQADRRLFPTLGAWRAHILTSRWSLNGK